MQDSDSILQSLQRRVDSILQKLGTRDEIKKIRIEIANLIFDYLHLMKNSLGYWEKMYFANSILALAWHINSAHKPPQDSWLRLCLVSLENVFVPPENRAANRPPRNSQTYSLSFDQLIEAINEIRTILQN